MTAFSDAYGSIVSIHVRSLGGKNDLLFAMYNYAKIQQVSEAL